MSLDLHVTQSQKHLIYKVNSSLSSTTPVFQKCFSHRHGDVCKFKFHNSHGKDTERCGGLLNSRDLWLQQRLKEAAGSETPEAPVRFRVIHLVGRKNSQWTSERIKTPTGRCWSWRCYQEFHRIPGYLVHEYFSEAHNPSPSHPSTLPPVPIASQTWQDSLHGL